MHTQLENDLKTGLTRGEVVPYFQPLIDLRTHELAGFEVLARWHHPQLGILAPDKFIALAEKCGLIGLLTEQTACQAFAVAQRLPSHLGIAINISAIQLRNDTLPQQILDIAHATSFSLNRLTIEVTETALVDNIELALKIASDFKALGAKLALDDFGTGYSSLTHLQALPFDSLKVDRSFVNSMVYSRDNRKIVAAVIGLGRSLGLKTVAEGVETQAQAEMLAWLGCDEAQGWLYGKAMPPDEVSEFCRTFSIGKPAETSAPAADMSLCLDALPSQQYAQLRAIYDGAPVGLCFLDTNVRYVSLNRRMAEINKASVEVHIGRRVEDVVPEIFSQLKPFLARALAGEEGVTFEIEKPLRRGEDVPETLFGSYQPARDEAGEVVGISVAVIDITERARQTAALRASEDHFQNMVELNPQVHWSMDPDGSNTIISSQWEKITGEPADQAHHVGWLRAVHEDDFDRVSSMCAVSIASGECIDVEYRVSNGCGGWHWVRSRGAPLQGTGGKIAKWYGCVELIDEHKQAIENLKGVTARLEAIIESVPVGVIIAEAPSGRIVSQNSQARRMFHEDAQRTAYGHNGRPIAPRDLPLERAIQEGRVIHSDLCFYEEGDLEGQWVRVTGTPIRNEIGEIVGAVSTLLELDEDGVAGARHQREMEVLCT